jgi:glycine betaine/proline transport system substrate-binding protein
MKNRKSLLASLLTLGLLVGSASSQASGWCESGKSVKFAGLNWESGMLLTDIMMIVLKDGYGCTTDQLVGNTIILETALAGNDIQVFGEEWMERSEVWKKLALRSLVRLRAGMCRVTSLKGTLNVTGQRRRPTSGQSRT